MVGEPGLENPEPDANTLGSCLWLHQAGAGGQWREWPVSSLGSGWEGLCKGVYCHRELPWGPF